MAGVLGLIKIEINAVSLKYGASERSENSDGTSNLLFATGRAAKIDCAVKVYANPCRPFARAAASPTALAALPFPAIIGPDSTSSKECSLALCARPYSHSPSMNRLDSTKCFS